MKIPGQEVSDAEKALLEKTSKLERLLAEASTLVDDINSTASKHGTEFTFADNSSLDSEELEDASYRVITSFKGLFDAMGWNSSSIGC